MPRSSPGRAEAIGLDVAEHGEEAYTSGEGAILVMPEAGTEPGLAVRQP
jgi:ammonium transporter, Amt family